MHLRRGSFKEATTPRPEKRVAAKDEVVADIGDVAARVSRNFHHAQRRRADSREHDGVGFAKRVGDARDLLVCWAVDRNVATPSERRYTAGMIGMVMGHKNGSKF